jgi:hypothetical protein
LKRYASGLIAASPLLAAEVTRETADEIEFANGAILEVATCDYRLVRSRTVLALLGDEACFWATSEDAASSDEEVVAAGEPGMAMVPGGGLLLLSSTPHMKRGYMFRRWRELTGNDEAADIAWTAPSERMNPSLPATVVAKAMADDPARAKSEYLATWREDLSDFVPVDVIDACTDWGVRERPPLPKIGYRAFVDAAGGTGTDSFTMAIAHTDDGGAVVLDVLRERKPRFVPAAVVAEYAELLRSYGITEVVGDRNAAAWCSDEFERRGVRYRPAVKPKSEIYLSALPQLLAGRARLLDNSRLRQQLAGLQRRVHPGGRESVDHLPGPSHHDDLPNSTLGATWLCAGLGNRQPETRVGTVDMLTGQIRLQERDPRERTRIVVRSVSESQQESFFRF